MKNLDTDKLLLAAINFAEILSIEFISRKAPEQGTKLESWLERQKNYQKSIGNFKELFEIESAAFFNKLLHSDTNCPHNTLLEIITKTIDHKKVLLIESFSNCPLLKQKSNDLIKALHTELDELVPKLNSVTAESEKLKEEIKELNRLNNANVTNITKQELIYLQHPEQTMSVKELRDKKWESLNIIEDKHYRKLAPRVHEIKSIIESPSSNVVLMILGDYLDLSEFEKIEAIRYLLETEILSSVNKWLKGLDFEVITIDDELSNIDLNLNIDSKSIADKIKNSTNQEQPNNQSFIKRQAT